MICAALSDMAGFEAGRADGYPHFSRTPGMCTPEKVKTMAYYDVVNFARLVKAETYITWGYNDDVCAPTTSYAAIQRAHMPQGSPHHSHQRTLDFGCNRAWPTGLDFETFKVKNS